MIVYNAEPIDYSSHAIKIWKNKGYDYQTGSWSEIESKLIFDKVSILIVRLGHRVDAKVLKKFPDLIYLLSATTGQDHLDVEAIEGRGIKLLTLLGHNEFLQTIPSTAEHTWALLMALVRKIVQANESVNKGNWNRDQFRGFQLYNKTIGLIGLGRIGSIVAKYAQVFGMQVQYYDPEVDESKYQRLSSLNELVQTSDIISVHVHLNQETKGLISSSLLQNLKHGALLINTSRGRIMDENAVIDALRVKCLSGVAVDVLTTELSNVQESPLWQARNDYSILITPHIGGATYDAIWSCEEYIQKLVSDIC